MKNNILNNNKKSFIQKHKLKSNAYNANQLFVYNTKAYYIDKSINNKIDNEMEHIIMFIYCVQMNIPQKTSYVKLYFQNIYFFPNTI